MVVTRATSVRIQPSLREGFAGHVDAGRIDWTNGVIPEVKVLGLRSGNPNEPGEKLSYKGRDYLPEANRAAVGLIEGATVYLDHKAAGRSVKERFGKLVGVYCKPDGSVWAKELRFDPSHEFKESLKWQIENTPRGIGLSVNANGEGYIGRDGRAKIERITKVTSVDLVDNPATTLGLFESTNETLPMEPLTPPVDTPAAPTDPKEAFAAMLATLAGQLSPEAVKELLLDGLKKLDAGVDVEPDATEEGDTKLVEQLRGLPTAVTRTAAKRLEQVIRSARLDRRRALALQQKLPAPAITGTFLEQLAAVDEPHALKLIEDRRSVVGISAPKSPNLELPPVNPKELAKSYFK